MFFWYLRNNKPYNGKSLPRDKEHWNIQRHPKITHLVPPKIHLCDDLTNHGCISSNHEYWIRLYRPTLGSTVICTAQQNTVRAQTYPIFITNFLNAIKQVKPLPKNWPTNGLLCPTPRGKLAPKYWHMPPMAGIYQSITNPFLSNHRRQRFATCKLNFGYFRYFTLKG